MTSPDRQYIEDNRHAAERLLVLLQRRRLLRERQNLEQYEECRKSAHNLRKLLENELLTIRGGGPLREATLDMQRACTNFVSLAGRKSENFEAEPEDFEAALHTLRVIFAQRTQMVVDIFELDTTPEIEALLSQIS